MRDKLFSGRWLLTLFSGLALLSMTATDVVVAIRSPEASLPFSAEALFAIVSAVVAYYFSKPPEQTSRAEAKPGQA